MSTILIGNVPMAANLNLAAQLLMGLALVAGMFLARRKLFRAHAICQSLVVLLNLIPIAIYMLPVFRRGVLPTLPGTLGDRFYAVSTIHATLGLVAEVFGLYILLNAGTKFLPQALRFENYKRWMRAELALWWLVIAIGVGTYWVWYQAGAVSSSAVYNNAAQDASAKALTATITLSNFKFEPKELTVEPGTVVVWKDIAGPHTIKADDGSFESEILSAGQEFSHKFETEGRYPYFCTLHGSEGGHDMAGVIAVARRAKP
jgi:plastocyanin